jgi:hypothetical protein
MDISYKGFQKLARYLESVTDHFVDDGVIGERPWVSVGEPEVHIYHKGIAEDVLLGVQAMRRVYLNSVQGYCEHMGAKVGNEKELVI